MIQIVVRNLHSLEGHALKLQDDGETDQVPRRNKPPAAYLGTRALTGGHGKRPRVLKRWGPEMIPQEMSPFAGALKTRFISTVLLLQIGKIVPMASDRRLGKTEDGR